MKYKYLAILITVIFILSCLNGVFAHPGHGTEYVEEVSSSGSSSPQSVSPSTSGGDSSQSSGSSSGGSSGGGSSQSSGYNVAGSSDASTNDNLNHNSTNQSAVNNSSSNLVVNEDSQLFSITNILIIVFALIIGFLAVILISKLFK
ncbi:hypothetical protein [uncultured Methanobrevibacter sp.]|uniref:hypothetical protein n=1 Tax=uncultured Methanobrevibacter sp. TaxID=253161 RepID=UPI0025D2CBF9|nr:hypothetical protein [uncultured Methanobrevibacter sp.]